MVSDLKFKSLIHFEFILVYGVRKWSGFILLHVAVESPTPQRKKNQKENTAHIQGINFISYV